MNATADVGKKGKPMRITRTFAAYPDELDRWQKLADEDRMSLSAWIREAVLAYESKRGGNGQ